MAQRRFVMSIGCATVLACGGGGNTQPDTSLHGLDGGHGGDAGSAACEALASYAPAFGSADQSAFESGSGTTGTDSHYMQYLGKLDSDAKYDQLVVELFAGIGTFAGSDIAPKSIALTGDELQYKTCGACVRVFADVDDGTMAVGQYYMATAGTLELTQAAGDLDAMLTGVTLTHVTIGSDFTSTPVGDCDTAIPSLAISAHIDEAAGSGSGSAALAPGSVPHAVTPGMLRPRWFRSRAQ